MPARDALRHRLPAERRSGDAAADRVGGGQPQRRGPAAGAAGRYRRVFRTAETGTGGNSASGGGGQAQRSYRKRRPVAGQRSLPGSIVRQRRRGAPNGEDRKSTR